jgi:hypothetical protein
MKRRKHRLGDLSPAQLEKEKKLAKNLWTFVAIGVGVALVLNIFRKVRYSGIYGASTPYDGQDSSQSPASPPTQLASIKQKYFIDSLNDSQRAAFRLALPTPRARALADAFISAGEAHGINPFLLAAIAERESNYGAALDSEQKGDSGHGHGIMQIDDGTWNTWLIANAWRDPDVNIGKAADILADDLKAISSRYPNISAELLAAAVIGAYNAGRTRALSAIANGVDIDNYTTDNYVAGNKGVKRILNRILSKAKLGVGAA